MNFQQIQDLGDEIHAKLRKANFDEAAFPEIAAESLVNADLDTEFQLDQVARFLVNTKIRQQRSVRFSNLPSIVYRCDDFHIELLVWIDATTSIHQHSFSGAFRVLAGSSIHSVYQFEDRQKVSSRLLIGDAKLDKVEILRQGDVRKIYSGRAGLLHSLFHLDRPSITLVVRNAVEEWALPQYALARPNIAYAQKELGEDPIVCMMGRLLDVAAKLDREHAADLLISQGIRLDFPRLFMVLRNNASLLDSEAQWQRFLEGAREIHGDLTQYLEHSVRSRNRESSIIATRNSVEDPDLRFFLALLLNVPSREWIDRLVEDQYPAERPESLYCQWLKRLSDEESLATAFRNLAEEAQLGRYRFCARLGRAFPFENEDPRIDQILRAALERTSPKIMASGEVEDVDDTAASSAAVEAYDRLLQIEELEPLFAR